MRWPQENCHGSAAQFELHPCDETRTLYVQGRRDLRRVLRGKERHYSQR